MREELLQNIVDYIETTDSVIRDLGNRPTFSATALEKAASALADADFIGESDKDEIVEMFRTNPDKALESMVKVAEAMPRISEDYSLGAPSTPTHRGPANMKESDRALYSKLGLL